MAKAKQGDMVRIRCHGRLVDGREFDLARNHDLIDLIIGHGDYIPALEQSIVGMSPGESRVVIVPKDKGYGERDEGLLEVIDRDEFPEGIEPKIGLRLRVPTDNYKVVHATITNISGSKITLDANHPLAGEDLLFNITLVEIVPDDLI
ncbi:MAG: FKBP-type peptidyl-prolyl cis-trans isomerase [Phycisphaerae bacterium]|nr:FKBP-type peptidyl-prolyl cis-trans isomerase [Phycisphaerae bacterium]